MTNVFVDYTATSRRMTWQSLPAVVRTRFADLLGSPVQRVQLAGGGFTPGFAAILTGVNRSIFVKAACAADTFIHPAYVREAEVLALMPHDMPVPQLLDGPVIEDQDVPWQLLCFEAVHGRMPGAPWSVPDLLSIHESLISIQAGLKSVPAHLTGGSMSEEFDNPDFRNVFEQLGDSSEMPDYLSGLLTRKALQDLQGLCHRAPEALRGDAVLHNDLRADNVIMRQKDNRAFICDWNFLSTGPEWADWVGLLPYARHGGLDVEQWLTNSPLTATADPEDIDAWLGILAAYMVVNGARPYLESSPYLRAHGRFTAKIVLDWLSVRRCWR
ncbi:aminoglycoside phosphotransferase (APT) family kinase protein [Arthrobacter roseus]|nr:aminoglycoside phosphotransferase (APT) family kinase protein [Arthrobacter roseus]